MTRAGLEKENFLVLKNEQVTESVKPQTPCLVLDTLDFMVRARTRIARGRSALRSEFGTCVSG